MSERYSGPLVVEGTLADAERMKRESNYLRGTITQDLNDGLTGGFNGDNFLLIRFHGMYQQDDRDIRAERAEQKLEPRHAMMLRCRLPGGVMTPQQWLAIDKFAGEKNAVRQYPYHEPSNLPVSRYFEKRSEIRSSVAA
ncbi:hypothetical protein DZS_22880 [Dickeya ananatis]